MLSQGCIRRERLHTVGTMNGGMEYMRTMTNDQETDKLLTNMPRDGWRIHSYYVHSEKQEWTGGASWPVVTNYILWERKVES